MNMKIAKIFHADHGIPELTIAWGLDQPSAMKIGEDGVFTKTVVLPADHPDVENRLHGPVCGDPPVRDSVIRVRDAADAWRQETPFVKRSPRPSRIFTIVGMVNDDESVTIFTAYGGPLATRIPSDPSLVPGSPEHEQAVAFWKDHALSEPDLKPEDPGIWST